MNELVPLRRICRVVNGGTPTPDPDNWNGDVVWVTPADLGRAVTPRIRTSSRTLTVEGLRSAASLVPAGSIVLSTRAPIGHLAIADVDLAFNQGCKGLVPQKQLDERYLYYQLIAKRAELESLGQGATFTELSGAALGGVRVTVPPLAEQRRIAATLDGLATHTRGQHFKLGRLALVAEERFAARLQAMVLGRALSPSSRDSAVDPFVWFARNARDGLHPRRLKFLLTRNESGAWGRDPVSPDESAPVVRSTEIRRDGRWSVDAPAVRHLTKTERAATALALDDIVVVTSSGSAGHLGKSAVVDEQVADMRASFSNFLQRLRCSPEASARFVWYLLNSSAARAQMAWLGTTTTGLRNLNGEIIGSVLHPGMTRREQDDVACALDCEKHELDTLLASIDHQRSVLLERQDALVRAAVTGEIDPAAVSLAAGQ